MADGSAQTEDPLHSDAKTRAARVRRESVRGVSVFVVETESVYPRQAAEIASALKGGVLAAERPKVLADLSGVRFVCSAFIGKLMEVFKESEQRGGTFKICVKDERVAYTMKLVRLDALVEVGCDRAALIESF